MELVARTVGPWPMNTYALICPETRESVLFDPGADPDTLEEMLANSTPIAIILTHTHPDHIGALEEMRQRLGVPLLAAYTPGHIPDMICFGIEGDTRVIVGDTIFAGGPGRTWSAADFKTTLQTLRNVVLSWPDDTLCYPGHGPVFRLGDLREQIEAFVDRDHGADFHGDAEW
jgi:glyoxylase-like metal-dependent hydrolase (beta-lactamase superfamily II)